jgi:hypothetical protein
LEVGSRLGAQAGENSPAIANLYAQRNRNAYVDRPEYAWSVFADQQNDTRLSVTTPDANGASTANVNLGRVLRNAPVPVAQNVTLTKAGVDGTYYSVTTSGAATSSVTGRNNAFAMDATGTRNLTVGLSTSTSTAGHKSGTVVVDNLDVTNQGGVGRGANDGNDAVNISLAVLSASNSSFSTSESDSLSLDFGTIPLGGSADAQGFSIVNLASSLGVDLTAGLDFDLVVGTGDVDAFSLGDLGTFANLKAGGSNAYLAHFDTTSAGVFDATYTLLFSDENLPGTVGTTSLTLNLTGEVAAVPEPAAIGIASLAALGALRRRLNDHVMPVKGAK